VKALAQFAMRGQWQAMFLTVAGAGSALFCWISAAIIALVSLQQGPRWGGYLLFWALLPSGLLVYLYGDAGPLMLLVSAWVIASALALTGSLSSMLLASVPVGLVSGLLMVLLGDAYLQQLVDLFDGFLTNLEQSIDGGADLVLQRPSTTQIAGVLAVSNSAVAVGSVLLGAYWQSSLYLPGLFGREFVKTVFPPAVGVGLLLAAGAVLSLGTGMQSWATILIVPLVFSSLGLVHARARALNKGSGYFAAFYGLWVLVDLLKLVLVVLAALDSLLGLRKRYLPKDAANAVAQQDESREDKDL